MEALGVRDREKVSFEPWLEGRQSLSMLHREREIIPEQFRLGSKWRFWLRRITHSNDPVACRGEAQDLFEEDITSAAGRRKTDERAFHCFGARIVHGPFLAVIIIHHNLIKCEMTTIIIWVSNMLNPSVIDWYMCKAKRAIYIIERERERERERRYNKVQACFLVETFYSEFSPLRTSSRPG